MNESTINVILNGHHSERQKLDVRVKSPPAPALENLRCVIAGWPSNLIACRLDDTLYMKNPGRAGLRLRWLAILGLLFLKDVDKQTWAGLWFWEYYWSHVQFTNLINLALSELAIFFRLPIMLFQSNLNPPDKGKYFRNLIGPGRLTRLMILYCGVYFDTDRGVQGNI